MYEDAANEEIEWARYLFQDGSMLGLNAEILTTYMKYLTNKRLNGFGAKSIFPKTDNPISWIKAWTDSKEVQVAPQETEISSYRVSSTKNDINKIDFNKYDF